MLALVLLPFALIAATPYIVIRALVLARRGEQSLKIAALDSYGSVWDSFVGAFAWPFVSDLDRLQKIHRQSSNQSLQSTAGRRESSKK